MTAYPGPNLDDTWVIVRSPMGLRITARCDTAWIGTRDCSDISCTEMQCLRPLRHAGARVDMYTNSGTLSTGTCTVHTHMRTHARTRTHKHTQQDRDQLLRPSHETV